MNTEHLIRAALVASFVLAGGCGGEDDGDVWDDVFDSLWDALWEPGLPTLTINEPSRSGSYATSANQVHIAGTTSDPDADIFWTDSAGGEGDTTPAWEPCLFSCVYDWEATVPLSIGYNLITVVASGEGGTSMAVIAITRH
jgi:hypothetical protein